MKLCSSNRKNRSELQIHCSHSLLLRWQRMMVMTWNIPYWFSSLAIFIHNNKWIWSCFLQGTGHLDIVLHECWKSCSYTFYRLNTWEDLVHWPNISLFSRYKATNVGHECNEANLMWMKVMYYNIKNAYCEKTLYINH